MILSLSAVAEVQTEFVFNDSNTVYGDSSNYYNSWLMYGMTTSDWTKASIRIDLTEGTMNHSGDAGGLEPVPEAVSYYDTGGLCPKFNPLLSPWLYWDWNEEPDYFNLTWIDEPDDGAGTWLLGVVTITTDAMGTITGTNYDADTSENGVDFAFEIVNGQIVPEPASVALLLLGFSALLKKRKMKVIAWLYCYGVAGP